MAAEPGAAPATPEGSTRTVGVVGAGTMGAGIAQVALEAGWRVRLCDVAPDAVERARSRIWDGLLRRAEKLAAAAPVHHETSDPAGWADTRIGHLEAVTRPQEAAEGAELVIEAAVEELAAKRELFKALDWATPPATILATNTSALSISRIAEAARANPERVLGLHFFNPAPVMRLVEVISHPRTDPALARRAMDEMAAWGKVPIACADRPGFIVNRVNRPFTLEPLRLLRAGAGSVEWIDTALMAAGFPMGPFALMDLVGLDVNLATSRNLFEAFERSPRFRPSPIQERLVEAGHLGRKTGAGFYRYDSVGRAIGPSQLLEDEGARGEDGGAPVALDGEAIAERTILAIVNEAYRALGEKVATADDIDLALRLGANHPFGPFAWTRRTGPAEVALMLDALADEDADTFRPAIALLREAAG